VRKDLRKELGLEAEVPLVGLVARFDPQKNHFGFLQAAELIHQVFPAVNFVFAGFGVDETNVAFGDQIRSCGLSHVTHLLGKRDDMPRVMASLDVLASSSSFGEAFPNVIGEAMACGVPCVVTDVGDSAEIVGDTGRVVKPGDMHGLAEHVIDLLALLPADRRLLGLRARGRVSIHYEIGEIAERYAEFYKLTVREK